MDGNHLVILYTLSAHDIDIDTHILVDCGCTGLPFINDGFVHQYNVPHYQLKNPETVEVIESRPISCGNMTRYIEVQYMISDHYKTLTAYLISLRHYPLILGIPWLKRHNVNVNFSKMDIPFSSPRYLAHHAIVTPVPIKRIITEHNDKIHTMLATTFQCIVNNANKHYGNME
jgi:hypothetical protein